jgi:hypothetical protein
MRWPGHVARMGKMMIARYGSKTVRMKEFDVKRG